MQNIVIFNNVLHSKLEKTNQKKTLHPKNKKKKNLECKTLLKITIFCIFCYICSSAIDARINGAPKQALGNNVVENEELEVSLNTRIQKILNKHFLESGEAKETDKADEVAFWYQKYYTELNEMHFKADAYCDQDGVSCLSDSIEMELSYMRIRHFKPKLVWEISPSHGYSTLWLAEALLKNNNGARLISFDKSRSLKEEWVQDAWTKVNWEFRFGDVRETYKHEIQERVPDYVFLDSYHSAEFGNFYIHTLFQDLRRYAIRGKKIYISLHDVYNPSFWTDGKDIDLRKRANLPDWLANEEGQVILDWLLYHNNEACCPWTVAPSHNKTFTLEILTRRDNAIKNHVLVQPKSLRQKWLSIPSLLLENNPTLYFTLLC